MPILLQEFYFANAIFNNCGLSQLIDKELGDRVYKVGYSFRFNSFCNWTLNA